MSAPLLTTCPICGRGFTAALWGCLRLLGHTKSAGRLIEVRVCCCDYPCEAVVTDSLIFAGRLDLVETSELPVLAEIAWGVVASAPPDRMGTPAVEHARLIERQLRAELERRLQGEVRRHG